ncbi:hypothetical protein K2F54_05560 [Cryobacterium sp. 1639]|uniref:hypothetical protein n=1 Tax=Cryobacterium inferilacus TaxID=2866629 RepID=UPI001C736891|nr:hypothetical protein [Cryobacterium sp. 1639]MBX0299440.1 hypothetical protein [Cryobacterium sp. 1639]
MTVPDILTAMVRRWYVPLGVFGCAALVTLLLLRDGGIYTTSPVVTFMRPTATSLSPHNGTDDSSVVAFAGAVVTAVNKGRAPAPYSMASAPYYGAGIREGIRVDLADAGNQWSSTFSRSDVEIRIVGRSLSWVEAKQDEMVDLVTGFAAAEQAVLEVPGESRITASVAPLTTQIEHIVPSRGNQLAAAAAMLAVALILSGWGSITVDRRLSRRGATTAQTQAPSRRILEGTSS